MLRLLLACGIVLAASPAFAKSLAACIKEHELAHAAGWGSMHPGAIRRPDCAVPMPPHPFKFQKGAKPVISYLSRQQMDYQCGSHPVLGCSQVGGLSPHVYLPAWIR